MLKVAKIKKIVMCGVAEVMESDYFFCIFARPLWGICFYVLTFKNI